MEWFYGGIFETYFNGQTPGKRLVGIRTLTSMANRLTASKPC
jgi:uncharacterized RDD family membrane protein YckC